MRTHPHRQRRPDLFPRSIVVALLAALGACGGSDGISDPGSEDPPDPCTVTPAIGLGQSMGGSLAANDCRRNGYVNDRWELELSATTNVQVDLTSQAFDPYLEIRTASGSLVAENDDWNSYNSRILERLPSGRYILVARGFDPSATGPYTLSVREGPDCRPLADVGPGSTVDGSLASGDCFHQFGGLVDWYALDLAQSRKLRLDLVGSFNEVVLLADQDGYIFDGADWNHPSGHARLDATVPSGSWLVGVASLSESEQGSYTLSVQDAPPCSPGGSLTLGETLDGVLTGDDCVLYGLNVADSVGLVLDGPTDLSILAKSPDMDPLVVVRDTAGMDVAVAYVQASPGVAEARISLPAGDYAVFVASTSWPGTGAYSLTVDEIVCSGSGTLAPGSTVQSSLDASDCIDGQGRFREVWGFDLAAESTVQFDLTSAAFDAYLILEDADGNELARDDDGGGGTNSRLSATLAAGSYRVVATSFGPGATGDYALSAGSPSSAPVSSAASAGTVGSGSTLKTAPEGRALPSDVLRRLVESGHRGSVLPSLAGLLRKD